MISSKDFILPSESVIEIPSANMDFAHLSGGAASLESIDRSAVPDFVPLIPELAMRPIATAASSMFIPKDPIRGATYWNV